MLQRFYPNEWKRSIEDIPFEEMYERGYRGVIFDIDNTLVPHNAPADTEIIEFFASLKRIGFSTCLLSNNKKARVEPFASMVGSEYIEMANKPSKRGYLAACRRMDTRRKETLFVGDQIFTDIYGANRSGLHSILVQPINPKEEIQIILKRYLERIILFFYKRHEKNRGNTEFPIEIYRK